MSRTRHKHDKLAHAPYSLDTKSSRAIRFSRRSCRASSVEFLMIAIGPRNYYCESELNEMHFGVHAAHTHTDGHWQFPRTPTHLSYKRERLVRGPANWSNPLKVVPKRRDQTQTKCQAGPRSCSGVTSRLGGPPKIGKSAIYSQGICTIPCWISKTRVSRRSSVNLCGEQS